MSGQQFDYSAMWERSGLTIADPWVRAKDLAALFPQATVDGLKKRFTRCRQLLGKRRDSPVHVAEIAHALEIPIAHVVSSVKQARRE